VEEEADKLRDLKVIDCDGRLVVRGDDQALLWSGGR
jgi:hypothetical protein